MIKNCSQWLSKGVAVLGVSALLAVGSAIPANASQAAVHATVSIHKGSVSLSNAKRAAQNYLNVMAFSRKGLIKQLVFDKYSQSVATAAVDSLKVNWKTQAVKSAKNYVNIMPFSRDALINQLVFDGYSSSEAKAGATGAGL
ncbi:MAG: hypothetical protein RL036_132 [Actinomycetota bacterium]|jgi:hypothetical protein